MSKLVKGIVTGGKKLLSGKPVGAVKAVAGGAAKSLGLNKIFSVPKAPAPPPMPAFEMPSFEMPSFNFSFPEAPKAPKTAAEETPGERAEAEAQAAKKVRERARSTTVSGVSSRLRSSEDEELGAAAVLGQRGAGGQTSFRRKRVQSY